MTSVLEQLDWIVLGVYFLALIGVAVWVFIQKNKNTEDYFLAGRNVGWFVIGASIFASNIGSEHVVGLAGTGFESGTPMAHYELHAWIVLLLGWLFLPFYIRSGAFTTPEFLEKRFDSRSRWFLSVFFAGLCLDQSFHHHLCRRDCSVRIVRDTLLVRSHRHCYIYRGLYCHWRVKSCHLYRNTADHCSHFWLGDHHHFGTI